MKKEKQVCSITLARQLKELGVKQNSIFNWEWSGNEGDMAELKYWPRHTDHDHQPWIYSAFTCSELGEMLPIATRTYTTKTGASTTLQPNLFSGPFNADTEVDTRAMALIWLVKNGHLDITTL